MPRVQGKILLPSVLHAGIRSFVSPLAVALLLCEYGIYRPGDAALGLELQPPWLFPSLSVQLFGRGFQLTYGGPTLCASAYSEHPLRRRAFYQGSSTMTCSWS
jgi:hypothetical protein